MSGKENKLPPLPEDAFDGEKFSVEVKHEQCAHDVMMFNDTLKCKKCGAGWSGPQIGRLYEAFTRQQSH